MARQYSNRERRDSPAGGPQRTASPARPAGARSPAAPETQAGNGSLLTRAAAGVAATVAGMADIRAWRRFEPRWLQRVPGPPEEAAPKTFSAAQESTRRQECAGLLSYLRAAIDKPVPTVVIAGAATGAGTLRVADGLAEAARDAGLRLFSAELGGTPGRPVLQQRRVVPLTATGRGDWRLGAGTRPSAAAAMAIQPASHGSNSAHGSNGAQGSTSSHGSAGSHGASGNGSAPTEGAPEESRSGVQAGREAGDANPAGAGAGGDAGGNAAGAGSPASASLAPASPGALESFRAGGSASGLSRWFEHPGGSVDFILVEAPPLDGAADAALLARACDGLVLVVESAVTPRDSLRRAMRVAEASGCRVLGLVMSEPHHTLPNWLRRLVSGTSPGR